MRSRYPLWHREIPQRLFSPDHVHVWRISLDVNVVEMERLLGLLSGDEMERSSRFRFEKDKRRFIAARGSLRCILGFYLEQDPHHIRFAYGCNGKPQLTGSSGSTALQFNLSHSDAFALCAVTLHRNVGVDIERIRQDIAVEQIARQFFSQGEISSLERLHDNSLYETFFRYWTRKEAVLKATGDGISFSMNKVDVSVSSDQILTPVVLPDGKHGSTQWHVLDLFPNEDYAASVVVEGVCCHLTCLHYAF